MKPETDKAGPEDWAAIRACFRGVQLGGKLSVETGGNALVLRERYHPVRVAIWCYGITALTSAIAVKFTSGWFGLVFALVSAGLATLMVGIVVYLDRRPAVLCFDRATRRLRAPRQNLEFDLARGVRLGLRDARMDRQEDRLHGVVLSIATGAETTGRPVYVGHRGRHPEPRVEQFAKAAGLPVFRLPEVEA